MVGGDNAAAAAATAYVALLTPALALRGIRLGDGHDASGIERRQAPHPAAVASPRRIGMVALRAARNIFVLSTRLRTALLGNVAMPRCVATAAYSPRVFSWRTFKHRIMDMVSAFLAAARHIVAMPRGRVWFDAPPAGIPLTRLTTSGRCRTYSASRLAHCWRRHGARRRKAKTGGRAWTGVAAPMKAAKMSALNRAAAGE
jgi:hypothetical protein